MVTLRADNRTLTKGAKFSYLITNYQAGVTSIVVSNASGFAINDWILLGLFGSESTELVQVSAVNTTTQTLTIGATKFAHAEATRVTILPYNQVRFYHTAAPTFSTGSPVTGFLDIQADDFFSRAIDNTNSTGYGWFTWFNSTTLAVSENSNSIPYSNFGVSQVESVLKMFWSELNDNELRLINEAEAYAWLNEAVQTTRLELNLINDEYGASDPYDIAITANVREYLLPEDFSDVITVTTSTQLNASPRGQLTGISLSEIPAWESMGNGQWDTPGFVYSTGGLPGGLPKYYIRGLYIGFSPTPMQDTTYVLTYKTVPGVASSYDDVLNIPDVGIYAVRDYMLFRAATKLQRLDGNLHLEMFNNQINRLKATANKRDGQPDSWLIRRGSLV